MSPRTRLYEDLELNAADIAGSEFFKKLYVAEYDQFGGTPYGGMIGLYEFANTPQDMLWLKTMGKICAACARARSSPRPRRSFFGCDTHGARSTSSGTSQGLFDTPQYSAWNALRDTRGGGLLGLTHAALHRPAALQRR